VLGILFPNLTLSITLRLEPAVDSVTMGYDLQATTNRLLNYQCGFFAPLSHSI